MADVKVCSVDDVKPGSKKRVEVDGHPLCVVRIHADGSGDEWYAIGDTCSHANYSLCEGDLWEEEREIECPKHGSTFDLRTGAPQSLPATQPVPVYEVQVVGDDVVVSVPEAPGKGRA